jgi:hypothetical protein
MELRHLSTQDERDCFAQALTRARAGAGVGFVEKPRSRIGAMHLQFADLYGVFDENVDPDRMLGGFAIHALDMFGQSYPEPDLRYLPPKSVFEVGELWSCSRSGGVAARWGCGIMAGALGARALVIYPIIDPWDLTGSYPGFERAGAPVVWPFAQTIDGRPILVQPMVARDRGLEAMISMVSRGGFELSADQRVVRFADPMLAALGIRTAMRRAKGELWTAGADDNRHASAL